MIPVVVVVVFIFYILLVFFLGTRNVMGLYMPGSLTTEGRILARYKLDIVGVQEVRWDKGGIERKIQCRHFCLLVSFFVALRPNAGHGLLILEVSRSHTTTHHSR